MASSHGRLAFEKRRSWRLATDRLRQLAASGNQSGWCAEAPRPNLRQRGLKAIERRYDDGFDLQLGVLWRGLPFGVRAEAVLRGFPPPSLQDLYRLAPID